MRRFAAGLLAALLLVRFGMMPARSEELSILSWVKALANEQNDGVAEKLGVLTELGLSIPADMERLLQEELAEYGWTDFEFSWPMLLSGIGMGDFCPESGKMEPWTDSFFAFDAEMYDIGGDYGTFLENAARISGGGIQVSDFRCEIDAENEEKWIRDEPAVIGLDFVLNGRPLHYDAALMSDWMDCAIIDFVNAALEETDGEARLWCMFDGCQGMIVFYGDGEWAQRFEEETGCALATTAEGAMRNFGW